jgi:hypothetical protein
MLTVQEDVIQLKKDVARLAADVEFLKRLALARVTISETQVKRYCNPDGSAMPVELIVDKLRPQD